jgi:two-component system repressor protein LuxO
MEKVIVVDDDPAILRFAAFHLKRMGCDPLELHDGAALTPEIISGERPSAILIDMIMPGRSGLDTLQALRPSFENIPFIMMTAHSSIETAVEAMRRGAFDFIAKPLDPTRLEIAVNHAIKTTQLSRRLAELSSSARGRSEYHDMTGAHESMRKIYDTIDIVAPSNATVLITGESGTGKELVARALHASCGRKGPLIEVNCGAIPSELIESELFGHEKGAFTGASGRRTGAAENADGGSLFLDEICELPLNMQVKLLRFLQERYIQRVGGNEKITIDARIISATKKDPMEEVRAGRFRDDLFYRLNVIPVHIPPLRLRADDIPALTERFLRRICDENGIGFKGVRPDAMEILMRYTWPGNVRELKNTIDRIAIMNRSGSITAPMIPENIVAEAKKNRPLPVSLSVSVCGAEEIIPFEQVKKETFERALKICGGNVVEAAKKLGVGYNTIYRMMKEHGLK